MIAGSIIFSAGCALTHITINKVGLRLLQYDDDDDSDGHDENDNDDETDDNGSVGDDVSSFTSPLIRLD